MRLGVMAGRRISYQHLFIIQQQFQLDQHHSAIEYVLYFSSLIGFGCRLTEHRMPPQRQAWNVSGHAFGHFFQAKTV